MMSTATFLYGVSINGIDPNGTFLTIRTGMAESNEVLA